MADIEPNADELPPNLDEGPTLRVIAMPKDANPHGDMFGGWVLGQMDLAGGITARRRAHGRVATVGVEAMAFHRPVLMGDELCCFTRIERIGRTSIRVRIDAWVRRSAGLVPQKVTEGVFTYVAVDEQRRPRPIPAAEGDNDTKAV